MKWTKFNSLQQGTRFVLSLPTGLYEACISQRLKFGLLESLIGLQTNQQMTWFTGWNDHCLLFCVTSSSRQTMTIWSARSMMLETLCRSSGHSSHITVHLGRWTPCKANHMEKSFTISNIISTPSGMNLHICISFTLLL